MTTENTAVEFNFAPYSITMVGNAAWNLVHTAMAFQRVFLIYGPPGTGKTFIAQKHGDANHGTITVDCYDDKMTQELLGHWVPQGNQWSYHDGGGITAWREGKVLVVNELGRASGSLRDGFLPLLDSYETARILLADGETVRPNKAFKCVLTSNDDASDLDWALCSRMESKIRITHPHPELTAALNGMLSGLGTAVHNSFSDPTKYIDTRQSFAFARLINSGVPANTACQLAYGERSRDIYNVFAAARVEKVAKS